MGLYSYRASKELKDLLAKARAGGDTKRLNLAKEVDLARVTCERAIHLFDVSCLGPKSEDITPELKQAATRNLQDNLKLVADLTNQYAKLLVVSDEVFNAAQMDYILKGLAEVLAVHLEPFIEENPELIDKIIKGVGSLAAPDKGRTVNISIG